MSRTDFLREGGTPFDGFLYAAVGEDRGGNTVSVLSTLARLGLDPWDEAADLADLPRADARSRLERHLAGFGDVPALRQDEGTIILRLVELLPAASGRTERQVGKQGRTLPSTFGALGAGPLIAVLLVILFLAQGFFFGAVSPGN
ncbi:MAG: hypothetical protein JJU19_01150 [Pararhodobacter sp.]|nr:hypothetical protein [Pararhodobacter sp.]